MFNERHCISIMKNDLQSCPGNSLTSFLNHIAYDLKTRRIEYLIIAYFNQNGIPLRMRQVTGRTSWVGYSIAEIVLEANMLEAKGICIVHNHPVTTQEKPALQSSSQKAQPMKILHAHPDGWSLAGFPWSEFRKVNGYSLSVRLVEEAFSQRHLLSNRKTYGLHNYAQMLP